jgi:phosphoglycerate dehydrogenase-like enzyme
VSPAVVVNEGRYGRHLLPALQRAVPDERFLLCGPRDEVAGDADVLVTFVDDTADIGSLLTDGIRWVHVLGTGIDGFALDALGDRVLTCSRGASAVPIAEWVLAMMLAVEKQLPASWITEPPKRWGQASLGGLAGRTVGIVGLGAIGTAVARRALAFDMAVVAARRTTAPPPIPDVAMVPSVADVAGVSDHLVLTAPATSETTHLVDAGVLQVARRGIHLVNVSRGTLVDQKALLDALDDGTVSWASLDVVDPEPLPARHPLYRHDRVRLSAHISWSDPRATTRIVDLFVENLQRWRRDEPLVGVVDRLVGY